MKNEHFERYIGELPPELQEKARQCKNMQELNALLAENDVELSEDALEAVSGGCSTSSEKYNQGDLLVRFARNVLLSFATGTNAIMKSRVTPISGVYTATIQNAAHTINCGLSETRNTIILPRDTDIRRSS